MLFVDISGMIQGTNGVSYWSESTYHAVVYIVSSSIMLLKTLAATGGKHQLFVMTLVRSLKTQWKISQNTHDKFHMHNGLGSIMKLIMKGLTNLVISA